MKAMLKRLHEMLNWHQIHELRTLLSKTELVLVTLIMRWAMDDDEFEL